MVYYQSTYKKPAISQAVYFYPTDKQISQTPENHNVAKITFAVHNESIRENILEIVKQTVFLNRNVTPYQIYIHQADNLNKSFTSAYDSASYTRGKSRANSPKR